MNISDSVDIKNSVKLRTILVVAALYLALVPSTFGIILLVLLIAGIITHRIVQKEVEAANASSNRFNKNYPFRYYGEVFGEFEHVFHHKRDLTASITKTISAGLVEKTAASTLESISITDSDSDLSGPESREFLKADGDVTRRGTSTTLIVRVSTFGQMQSIRWWVVAGGYIDNDKRFSFIALSPLTIAFWLIPYLKRQFDVLSRIRTIYSAAYNDMDVLTQIRCIHEVVFEAMVEELEKNGIDTSDIKAQRMQVMNINVSGGRVNMGNVVQGAMNKVAASVKKAA